MEKTWKQGCYTLVHKTTVVSMWDVVTLSRIFRLVDVLLSSLATCLSMEGFNNIQHQQKKCKVTMDFTGAGSIHYNTCNLSAFVFILVLERKNVLVGYFDVLVKICNVTLIQVRFKRIHITQNWMNSLKI